MVGPAAAGFNAIRSGRRRRGAPVVLVEERLVVLLGQPLDEALEGLRRAELPAERLLVRLQGREKNLVAQLLVESAEERGPLPVEEARPDPERALGVARHDDAVGERDRRRVA